MTTSYPFMRIAQQHNEDYGMVLCYADAMTGTGKMDYWQIQADKTLPPIAKGAIVKAVLAEIARRKVIDNATN